MRPGKRYICSKECRKCGRDYLWPPYGGKYLCNDCIMTYGRRTRW